MRIEKYLDQVMAKHGFKRDKQLAEWLGVTPVSVSNYRAGDRFMDNEKCVKIALELDMDPLKVIMATDMDKADRTGQKSLWSVFSERMAATAAAALLAAGVTLFLTPGDANAASMRVPEGSNSVQYKLCEIAKRKLCEIDGAFKMRNFGSIYTNFVVTPGD